MTTICTDASGLVVMLSDGGSPTPPSGGQIFILTKEQESALQELYRQPNDGVMFDGVTFSARPFVAPPPLDLSDADNLEKILKAVLLSAATMSGKSPAQARSAFAAAWRSL